MKDEGIGWKKAVVLKERDEFKSCLEGESFDDLLDVRKREDRLIKDDTLLSGMIDTVPLIKSEKQM